jgi:signal transduction histidine kinase
MKILFFLTLLYSFCFANAQTSSKGPVKVLTKEALLQKAYDYMSNDHYDSAQYSLNKIYDSNLVRKPTKFAYYLTTCQAEIYYYNNLHLLGLQESTKGENIANLLKDSVLLADSYNFKGLFYLNDNKLAKALAAFKKSLSFAKQPPYRDQFSDLTNPHHILGNLAETFEKLNLPDSAIYYSILSLKMAREINSGRGMATGALNAANAFFLKSSIDSARKYFELTKFYAIKADEFDVELTAFSGLADCAAVLSNKHRAFEHLQAGFEILNKYPQLNDFYAGIFLNIAINIYRTYGEIRLLNNTLELKSKRETNTYQRNNTQIQSLLLAGISNEKTIFKLALADTRHKESLANTQLYVAVLILLLFVIAFIAYRYYTLQRLRLANLRSKISQDLHDEVGATLSGIAMYSYITKEQIKKHEHHAVENSLDIIKDNASEMVDKLNDIVWAVNPSQDSLYALLERLKDFTTQMAATKAVELDFLLPEEVKTLKLSMGQRKNIYLICKEAINNAVKYSEASLLKVEIAFANKYIHILIADNGIGFKEQGVSKGNGLINMRNRAKEINAELLIDGGESIKGTTVVLKCKIT